MFCIPAVHEFNHGMAPFGGYRPFHVNPQHYSSPYSKTCYHSAPSTIFSSGRSLVWVTVHILVVLVCLPSHIRRKCSNFVPLMERWEGLCIDCNWLWLINRHPSAIRASYGTPDPSPCEVQPHHTFSDASCLSVFRLSTVTHLPGISGRSWSFGTTRPPQYELQLQSLIPGGDPHLSDPGYVSRHSLVSNPPRVIPPPLKPGKSALGTRLQ